MPRKKKVAVKPTLTLPDVLPETPRSGSVVKDVILPFVLSLGFVFGVISYLRSAPTLPKQLPSLLSGKKTNSTQYKAKLPLSKDEIMKYLRYEAYMYVDPVRVIDRIKAKDQLFVLVDIRREQEFKKGHIKGAVNIPVSSVADLTEMDKSKLIEDFKRYGSYEIIIYGESRHTTVPKEVVIFLFEKNISTKMLAIGWTDFRYFSNFWLPQDRWQDFQVFSYIEPVFEP